MSYYYTRRKVTKREVLFSVVIICVMFMIGILIHGNINDHLMQEYQKYATALRIENDSNLYKYALKTSVGHILAYGELKAINPVTYPEIGGEYGSVTKIKEEYRKHTRTVTKTRTVNGKTQTYTETETYWRWDEVSRSRIHVDSISFLDVTYDWGVISYPHERHICERDGGYHVRYQYQGSPVSCMGTLFAFAENNDISDTSFYVSEDIEQTLKSAKSIGPLIAFWIGWVILTGVLVGVFYYIDNKWLED